MIEGTPKSSAANAMTTPTMASAAVPGHPPASPAAPSHPPARTATDGKPPPSTAAPMSAAPMTTAPTTPVMARTGPPEPPHSARPLPAVEPIGPEGRSEFQRLLEEVESGFDAIVRTDEEPHAAPATRTGPPSRKHTGEIPLDATVARTLFDSMVAEHATPIRDFMIEVRLGEPLRTWVDFAMPAVRTIMRSADGMALEDFVTRLGRFADALSLASTGAESLIRGEVRQSIIDRYNDLITYLPEAFELEVESNKRESVIVHALLQQVEDLNMVGIDRIYAAGLTSLALYYVARASDIAEIAGLPIDAADRVIAKFREYRLRIEGISPGQNREQEVHRVGAIADELDRLTQRYEGMVDDDSASALRSRREIRKQRAALATELGLFMARLGEVDRLRAIERRPFAARVALLREYVHAALHVRNERNPSSVETTKTKGEA